MRFIHFILCLALVIPAFAQVPKVSNGKIIRLPDMQSVEMGARHVDVWLPPRFPAKECPFHPNRIPAIPGAKSSVT
jgi:hypothetical protein